MSLTEIRPSSLDSSGWLRLPWLCRCLLLARSLQDPPTRLCPECNLNMWEGAELLGPPETAHPALSMFTLPTAHLPRHSGIQLLLTASPVPLAACQGKIFSFRWKCHQDC